MTWELKSVIPQSANCMFPLMELNCLENTISKMSVEEIHSVQCIPPWLGTKEHPDWLKSSQSSILAILKFHFPYMWSCGVLWTSRNQQRFFLWVEGEVATSVSLEAFTDWDLLCDWWLEPFNETDYILHLLLSQVGNWTHTHGQVPI